MLLHDSDYLQQALDEAYRGRGRCAPNPAVGAVVVVDGVVRGRGYHEGPGLAHAEVVALQLAGERAEDADLYITLEPCSHWGRTPPCTEAILASGVKRVIYGYRDPNPRVSGDGANILRAAGIDVVHYPLEAINQFYQSYHDWLLTGKASLTAKLALSLDGKIAGTAGAAIAISGDDCRVFTHQGRLQAYAILTTVKTLLNDNPQFNVRLEDEIITKHLYVIDSRLEFQTNLQVLQTTKSITLLHGENVDRATRALLETKGIECVQMPVAAQTQELNWSDILTYLGDCGFHDIWLEAGGHTVQSALKAGVMSRLLAYVSPCWVGEQGQPAFTKPLNLLQNATRWAWSSCGRDAILDISYCEEPHHVHGHR